MSWWSDRLVDEWVDEWMDGWIVQQNAENIEWLETKWWTGLDGWFPHPATQQSIHYYIKLSMQERVHDPINQPVIQSMYTCLHPPTHPWISIRLSFEPCSHKLTKPSINLFTYLPITYQSMNHPFIHHPIHPQFHSCIHQWQYTNPCKHMSNQLISGPKSVLIRQGVHLKQHFQHHWLGCRWVPGPREYSFGQDT